MTMSRSGKLHIEREAPVAERRQHGTTWHGRTLEDPYAWLKDPGYPEVDDADVLAYLRDENAYFEFRIRIDAMTNEVALIVTDHAWPDEVEETKNLWNSQIASLIRVLGA